MSKSCFLVMLAAFLFAALSGPLVGAINVPSDGSDGVFNPAVSVEVDLSQAITGTWDQAGTGNGVYDPVKWAVVFKYSSVNIPAGVTVTFKNHPSRAPVVWLVQGNATIAGTVKLDGQNRVTPDPQGLLRSMSEPGPGGFRGGATGVTLQLSGGPGLGPGGGNTYYDPPRYEGVYGNVGILPLIGGSGSYGHPYSGSGGGGGGALLLAAGDTLTLSGTVSANGGEGLNYYGSGGGIRLVTDKLLGAGILTATSPSSSPGRIRIEANESEWSFSSTPMFTCAPPGTDPQIWPPTDKPRVKIVSLGGLALPADPKAGVTPAGVDAYFGGYGGVVKTLVVQAEHVPLTWHMRVRVAPINGTAATVVDVSDPPTGDETLSIWQVNLTLGEWYSAIQVRASVN